jgi:purine-binding chemotaxis protein CheW
MHSGLTLLIESPTMAQSISLAHSNSAKAGKGKGPAVQLSEFLSFKLGTEEYGIDILRVQEIRSYEEPTRIANAPHGVLGVLDLRGVIVPVVDMRLRFNLGEPHYGHLTVVIVLNIGKHVVGMVVDGVSDVIALTPQQMRPAPEFNSNIDGGHILAIAAVDTRMLILIDIEKLMSSPDMGLISLAVH